LSQKKSKYKAGGNAVRQTVTYNFPKEEIQWADGELAPLERVLYGGFPRIYCSFKFSFFFLDKTGVKGASADFISYSLIHCHRSMSCWIIGLFCSSQLSPCMTMFPSIGVISEVGIKAMYAGTTFSPTPCMTMVLFTGGNIMT